MCAIHLQTCHDMADIYDMHFAALTQIQYIKQLRFMFVTMLTSSGVTLIDVPVDVSIMFP